MTAGFTGTLRQSAGWPWVSVQGEEVFSLAYVSPRFTEVKAIEVFSNKPSADEETRKYGEIAYNQPRIRTARRAAVGHSSTAWTGLASTSSKRASIVMF
jgi:hypothetical protein